MARIREQERQQYVEYAAAERKQSTRTLFYTPQPNYATVTQQQQLYHNLSQTSNLQPFQSNQYFNSQQPSQHPANAPTNLRSSLQHPASQLQQSSLRQWSSHIHTMDTHHHDNQGTTTTNKTTTNDDIGNLIKQLSNDMNTKLDKQTEVINNVSRKTELHSHKIDYLFQHLKIQWTNKVET